jgi:hypothetical protein
MSQEQKTARTPLSDEDRLRLEAQVRVFTELDIITENTRTAGGAELVFQASHDLSDKLDKKGLRLPNRDI